MKNIADIMANVLEKYGRRVSDDENTWTAYISPLRYKNKMYLRPENTDIGKADDGYYLYVGPGTVDIEECSGYLECLDEYYTVDKTEKVYFGNDAVYVWAILRKAVL